MKVNCDFCNFLINCGDDIVIEKDKIYCLKCWNRLSAKKYNREQEMLGKELMDEFENEKKEIEEKYLKKQISEEEYFSKMASFTKTELLKEILEDPEKSKDIFIPKDEMISILNEENYKEAIKILKKR